MPVLRQVLEANRAYAEQFHVRYGLDSELPDAMLNVDVRRLMQVLANPLSNAAKFSPAGDRVEIFTTRNGEHIRVTVSDHGPGISKEFSERVFTRFSQANSSDNCKKGGSGLGLAITKELVEKMGGSIGFVRNPIY